MSENTDFAVLYRELGIDPNCSLVELRNAYRRRVAKLHPDQGGDDDDVERLQRLNRLYEAAVEFHRQYARLPGATHIAVPPIVVAARYQHADYDTESQFAESTSPVDAKTAGPERVSRYFTIVSVIGIGALALSALDIKRGAVLDEHGPAANTGMEYSAAKDSPTVILPGMSKENVLQLLGDPQDMHELRWGYGPSWVEFRCGDVVDWYSSPQRPLKTTSERGLSAGTLPPSDLSCE